ncbi:MAG: hypothetical protein VW907_07505, partial [Opitutae bacterium]
IDETAKSSLVTLADQTQSSGNNSKESDHNASSAWAEVFLVLESAIAEEYALSFHEESLDSQIFLTRLFDELNKSPVAKDLILKPFTSELLEGNEIEILSSLISIRPKSPKSLMIICKGHSTRAAHLLSELIIRNYNWLITSETSDSPIPDSLVQKLAKYQELECQMEDLKITIQEEMRGAPEESVEVMAIRSEIMQVDEEVNQFKQYLLKIDEIHKDKLSPNEYLHIPPIRDFGKVTQLADILAQLKSMRLTSSLNQFTRDQVEKNILANSKELEKEVVSAIEDIKQSVARLLIQKKELQQAAFDSLSEAKISKTKRANLEKFNRIKNLVLEAKKEYEDATLLWMSCKSSYSLYRAAQ